MPMLHNLKKEPNYWNIVWQRKQYLWKFGFQDHIVLFFFILILNDKIACRVAYKAAVMIILTWWDMN